MDTSQATQADFYVAPDGSDVNPGTLELPFATLHRARDAVRELKGTKDGPVVVLVRGGRYLLQETLVFTPDDSGTEEQPVSYVAYPGEIPTLSGGRKIECEWKSYRDGIMMCEIPEVKRGDLDFTQLFVDSKRQILARYPNHDPENPLVSGDGYINVKSQLTEELIREKKEKYNELVSPYPSPEGFIFDPETFTKKRWAKPEEAIVHLFPSTYWGTLQWNIKELDWDRDLIWFGYGGFQIRLTCRIRPNSRFYIENVFEELDAPGEWYLDRAKGVLYYMPPEGVSVGEADIVAPVLKQLVEFRGAQDEPVHHVTVSGFRMTHTTSIFMQPYEVMSLGDWNIHRSGAVFFEGAEHCCVERCFFDAVGGNGAFVNNYNRHVRVADSKFTEAGESAVCLVGNRYLTQGSINAFPADCVVTNNLVHDCGVFGKQVAGAFLANALRITISHNHIYDMPRAGICFNDCFGGGHVLEFNEIDNAVRETSDHGPFNSWGREGYWCQTHAHDSTFTSPHHLGRAQRYLDRYMRRTIIRNNYFHGIEGYGGGYRQAIDLDDGSSNFHLYNNLVVEMAIGCREGMRRTVENNIIINPIVPCGWHVGYEDNGDVFRRNIIVTEKEVLVLNWPPPTQPWLQIDQNLYFNPTRTWMYTPTVTIGSRDGSLRKYTLAEWQEMGYDVNSIVADPMFVDPDNGDYRVKPGSPAIDLGFVNFDMDKFGLTADFPEQWRG